MNMENAIRERILELCSQRNITIHELGIISGISQSTIHNIVSGRNSGTRMSTIQRLCDGLDISVLEFFSSRVFENIEREMK